MLDKIVNLFYNYNKFEDIDIIEIILEYLSKSDKYNEIVLNELIEKIEDNKEDTPIMTLVQKIKEKGKIEGKVEGKVEGKIEGKIETAKNMKEIGISIEIISQSTGLTIKEIDLL